MEEIGNPAVFLHHLPCALFFVERAGLITYANPLLLGLLGRDEDQVLGRPPEDFLDMADLDGDEFARGDDGRHPYIRTALRHADGGRVPILLGLTPIEESGERSGILAMALELKGLESSRPGPLFDPLDSLDKLKADFIAIASHELRTPLAIIKGYVDAFLTGELGEVDDFQTSRLGIIDARVDQMTGIINDLLDLGRISEQRLAVERNKVSLGDLVAAEVEGLQLEAAAKGHRLNCLISDGLPGIKIDVDRVRQALQNVLDNAMKFTPDGGDIEVIVGPSPAGGAIEIKVRDSGPGIPAEQLDRIFTMFYQVDATSTRRTGGLGLGLFIARGIAQAHGGDVYMDSETGKGSTCTIRLPLHAEGRP